LFSVSQQPPAGQGPPIIEASRSHSDISQSVGLLWKTDRPIAETCTWQHTVLPRRDSNPQSQQASGRRPTSYTARQL